MDKALGVIGQPILLQMVVALTLVITEELTATANAARTVGSPLSSCKLKKNDYY